MEVKLRFGTVTRLTLLAMLLLLGACAGNPASYPEPISDPLERFNRGVHRFNTTVDRYSLKPVARGYGRLPDALKTGVGNVFDNLRQFRTLFNDLLQGKLQRAAISTGRIVLNSTLGVAGIFDPASQAGLPEHSEDFAQTLAVWRVPSGSFLMLPLLGPSTTRDALARIVDILTHPLALVDGNSDAILAMRALDLVDRRYRLFPAEKALNDALDPYLFLREAYLQNMHFEIWDGNPPFEDLEDEDWDDEEWEVAPASGSN